MATQLASTNVVGRDRLIVNIWKLLRHSSVVFTAERRIGKTTVMQKMEADASDEVIAKYFDLEKVDTPERFVEVLLQEVKDLLPKNKKATSAFSGLMNALGGTELGGIIKIPVANKVQWQSALERTLACICENHRDSTILFLFDELPYMLQKISVREKKDEVAGNSALTILDSLRAIRSEHKNLRMIYSGSIGLHHVIEALRGAEYPSEPLNEMETIEIGPLKVEDANFLADQWLTAEEVTCADKQAVIDELVRKTDCVPFYIERVVKRLALSEEVVTPEVISRQVRFNLTDDNDHWEMEHFRTRIPIYYPGSINTGNDDAIPEAVIVRAMLDYLSEEDDPKTIDEIFGAVKCSVVMEDRPLIIQLLRKLAKDHYLIGDTQKNYSFRFPLIKQWWKLAQGL